MWGKKKQFSHYSQISSKYLTDSVSVNVNINKMMTYVTKKNIIILKIYIYKTKSLIVPTVKFRQNT
jgi:hypothetical protein